jgi:hypothetical protein
MRINDAYITEVGQRILERPTSTKAGIGAWCLSSWSFMITPSNVRAQADKKLALRRAFCTGASCCFVPSSSRFEDLLLIRWAAIVNRANVWGRRALFLWWNKHAEHFLFSRYRSISRSVGPPAFSLPCNLDDKTTGEAVPSRGIYKRQSKTN